MEISGFSLSVTSCKNLQPSNVLSNHFYYLNKNSAKLVAIFNQFYELIINTIIFINLYKC